MWKRLSIKSLTGKSSTQAETKQRTSITEEPLDQPSLGATLQDPNTNGTMQETVLDPQEQAEKVAEGLAPTRLPATQDSADDTGKQQAAPVSSNETSSADTSGSAPLGVSVSSGTTPPSIPRTEPAESASSPPQPSPVNGGGASSDTPGNVTNTPHYTNTLSVPGFEPPNLPLRRRLSFRSLAFFYGRDTQLPPVPKSQQKEHPKPSVHMQSKFSRAQKQALLSAITLRAVMIGPVSLPPTEISVTRMKKSILFHSNSTVSPPSPNLKKVKAQLLKPESANAIISNLRRLPLPDGPSFHVPGHASSDSLVTHPDAGGAPIHAVCLDCTDDEAEKKYFSRLSTGHSLSPPSSLKSGAQQTSPSSSFPTVATASLESLIPVLRNLHLVSLLTSPDLGFGQRVGDGEDIGVLTGSVPSPATLVEGFEEITTQLMNLGFATSKAVAPSHAGIYPPTDRISFFTYWWGLELALPEPSVKYLGNVKSISNAVLNFLSALALFNNGVREALPFIRYIANFVDFEWSSIKAQDKGQGVVCAATWVMPAAMVPRPWDFPSAPKTSPGSPIASTSPSAPETTPSKDTKATQETDAPMLPDNLHSVAPTLPLMPQLLVTPATLPRDFSAPGRADV